MKVVVATICSIGLLTPAPCGARGLLSVFKLGSAPVPRVLPHTRIEPSFNNLHGTLSPNSLPPPMHTGPLRAEPYFGPPEGSQGGEQLPRTSLSSSVRQTLQNMGDAELASLSRKPRTLLDNSELRRDLVLKPAIERVLDEQKTELNGALPADSRNIGISEPGLVALQREEVRSIIESLLDKIPPSAYRNPTELRSAIRRELELRAEKTSDPLATFDVLSGKLKIKKKLWIGAKGTYIEIELGEVPIYTIAVAAGAYLLICGDTFCSEAIRNTVDRVIGTELRRKMLKAEAMREPRR